MINVMIMVFLAMAMRKASHQGGSVRLLWSRCGTQMRSCPDTTYTMLGRAPAQISQKSSKSGFLGPRGLRLYL